MHSFDCYGELESTESAFRIGRYSSETAVRVVGTLLAKFVTISSLKDLSLELHKIKLQTAGSGRQRAQISYGIETLRDACNG
jgi:hypothetical protein